ncbi:MAG: L-2-amino-thiazoline-4-carboxylic acid hydrolase [Pikeienuella sp.]
MENDPNESPIYAQRRIEAKILKHVYDALCGTHGKDVAAATIKLAVRNASLEQAGEIAADTETSLRSFQEIYELWTRGGALETEVLSATDDVFDFNVTRCRYSEMYKEMGLGEIGHLLSCQRDGTFCEGYDERIEMTRTQTIMQGASHCDFRYKMKASK